MSFFLLQVNRWSQMPKSQKRTSSSMERTTQTKLQGLRKFDGCLMRHLGNHKEFNNYFVQDEHQTRTYGIYLPKISIYFTGLLTFVYYKQQNTASVFFRFLDKNGQYIKVNGSHLFTQVFRNTFLNLEAHKNSIKLLLNFETGCLSIQICYYSLSGSNLIYDMDNGSLFKSRNIVSDIYRFFVQRFIPIFEKSLKIRTPIEHKIQIEEPSTLQDNIQRYSTMMTCKANLSSSGIFAEESRNAQLAQREEHSRRLLEQKVNLDMSLIQSFEFYGNMQIKLIKKFPKGTHEFYVSPAEQKKLMNAIAFEDGRGREPITHSNVLNFIQIHEPDKMKTYPIDIGGFSLLQASEVSFWFVDSFSSQKEEMEIKTNRQLQRKFMAIKKQNRPHGKNLHQFKVLTEIRNGVNSLFPKYYIPINVPGHNHFDNPLLMMDYIADGTLIQLIRSRSLCMSLLSKLYLLFSVSMGLRYLQAYQIVHLDIKPNNIMIAPGLSVKIIDFGQAYHPAVWKKEIIEGKAHRPGFTLPYSPPQLILKLKQPFTSKADVYSFGVMMFEVLYGGVPFEKRRRCFFSPEDAELYGDSMLIRTLNWIIFRCLSTDPSQRPELDWISVILRLSLQMVL